LAGMSKLRELHLFGTQVSEQEILNLKKYLPNIGIITVENKLR